VLAFFETLCQDAQYGLRSFLKNPGSTSVALLSLVLGIGANTAIFSVVYCILIDPYPYTKPAAIWAPQVIEAKTGLNRGSLLD
jgi:hypothetical protein